MKFPLIRRKKLINELNRLMWEEHQENQFEESQVMRSYSSGIIDGIGLTLTRLSDNPAQEAPVFPISLSFYEESEEEYIAAYKSAQIDAVREKVFDLQNQTKYSLFKEEVD